MEAGADRLVASSFLYGRNSVLEALRAGRRIRRLLVAETAHGQPVRQLLEEAESRGVPVEFVPRAQLDVVSPHHQGVLAEAEPFRYASMDDLIRLVHHSPSPLVLALDHVQDPQNLGGILRSAAAFGAQGVVLPEHRAAGITAAVARASAGAVERLPIVQVTNLVRTLDTLRDAGLWAVGLDVEGGQVPWQVELTGPTVVVAGAEASGLARLVREHCDFVVRVPMLGPTESLNVSVAVSLVLYESLRQRLAQGQQR